MGNIRVQKFSYSKLNTYESCAWKYKLLYKDGHYIFTDSLASEFGTLLHYIEEQIAKTLKNHAKPDYNQLKNDFQNINIPKKSKFDHESGIYGINILKEKYKTDYYAVDANGSSYYTRSLDYLTSGIYRLETYLSEHPELEVYDTEKFFSVNYHGYVLSGYIDRILYNKEQDTYIIEDIKTQHKLFKPEELTTPLQFVIYTYALANCLEIEESRCSCAYDLPLLGIRQDAGTKGYMTRGIKKLDQIFSGIDNQDFTPHPSPLCHWCSFCPTNPEQTDEGKMLCPYYSLWTRENKTYEVKNKWQGIDKHEAIMQKEIQEQKADQEKEWDQIINDFDFDF